MDQGSKWIKLSPSGQFPKPPCIFFLIVLLVQFSWAERSPLSFELPDLDGKTHKLEDYRGKLVVLDFWAVWCVTCRRVFPVLNQLKEKYPEDKVAVLGISIDSKPAEFVSKFAKQVGLKYTVLLDPKGKSPDDFGIKAVPTLFLLNEKGEVLLEKEGFEGKKEEKEIFQVIDTWVKQVPVSTEKPKVDSTDTTPENPHNGVKPSGHF